MERIADGPGDPPARPDAPIAIRTWDLSKRFGARTAVEGLTIEVRAGDVFGFLGPNGAGKTTTIRMLTGLVEPSGGGAEVSGVPLAPENGREIRSRVSVLPETPGLYARLTVHENLEYFAGLYGWRGAEAARRITDALDVVGVGDRHADLAGSLSKGLRQRVALARSLLNDPAVVFFDEPTQGLDPGAAREVRALIRGLRERRVTIFLTTHRLEDAERLCDRVAFINTRLRSIGRPAELRRRFFAGAVEVLVASPLRDPGALFAGIPGIRRWSVADGRYLLDVERPRSAIPEIARAVVGAGADLLGLAEVAASLEDVYVEVLEGPPQASPDALGGSEGPT